MKKTLFIIVLTLFSCQLMAQEENTGGDEIKTLFPPPHSHGGYFSLGMGYSVLEGEDALTTSCKLAYIMDHNLAIGFAGSGFTNDILMENYGNGTGANFAGGYGGILVEPILFAKFPVHISFPILMGVGGAALTRDYYDDYDENWDEFVYDSDAFLVVEPGAEVELNIMKFFRIGVGASYRYTRGLKLQGMDSDLLNGVTFGASLKFGKF